MRLPNFVVIGAPKSGTTSLFFYLKQHPDVYLPVRKELHYFTFDDLAAQLGGPGDRKRLENLCPDQNTYKAHYAQAGLQRAVGDISPSYLYFSHAAARIRHELGEVKIVALLRNPLEKAFSQYSHLKLNGWETLSFHEALMQEEERIHFGWSNFWRYAESSLYADKLKQYLALFGHRRVRVLLLDDMVAAPDKFMGEVFTFLGIDPAVKTNTTTIYNRSGKARSNLVAGFFAKPNPVKSLVKKLVPEPVRLAARLKILDLNTAGKERMEDRSKAYLKDYFARDVAELESLLDRRTNWLQR